MMQSFDLTFSALTVILACYALQFFLAILNAARSTDNRPTVLKALFGNVTAITGTWTTIGIILVLPVLISWLSGLSDVLLDVEAGGAIFSTCLSMLLVLVTWNSPG